MGGTLKRLETLIETPSPRLGLITRRSLVPWPSPPGRASPAPATWRENRGI
jgi:hypothetical protein